jgi:hypothetical protein
MSENNKRPIDSYIWGIALVLCFVLVLGGAYLLWRRHDPYFDRSPDFADARAIQSAARHRPLTEEEFAACLRLCEFGESSAQLSAISSLETAVGRIPEYKPEALKVLKRVAARKEPKASASATAVLKRLSTSSAK